MHTHKDRRSVRWGRALVAAFILLLVLAACMWPIQFKKTVVPEYSSQCAANLAGIAKCLAIYANQHNGQLPPDLRVLVQQGIGTPMILSCPTAARMRGRSEPPPTVESDYIYISGQSEADDPSNVIAYDRPGNHPVDGANVLFADTHTQWIAPYSEVERLVAQTRQHIAIRLARMQEANQRSSRKASPSSRTVR